MHSASCLYLRLFLKKVTLMNSSRLIHLLSVLLKIFSQALLQSNSVIRYIMSQQRLLYNTEILALIVWAVAIFRIYKTVILLPLENIQ